jgi:hypothetical protein
MGLTVWIEIIQTSWGCCLFQMQDGPGIFSLGRVFLPHPIDSGVRIFFNLVISDFVQ